MTGNKNMVQNYYVLKIDLRVSGKKSTSRNLYMLLINVDRSNFETLKFRNRPELSRYVVLG